MKWIFCILIIALCVKCTRTNSLKVHSEFKKISKEYNKSICKIPYATKIAYLEKSLNNGKYIMLNQATGYMLSMGYACEIPLDNFCFLFTNFCKSLRKNEWLQYLTNLYLATPVKYQTDIAPGYNSALNCFRRFELNGPLNEASLNDFKYSELKSEIGSIKSLKFEAIYTNLNYEGIIFYNADNYRISKIVLIKCDFYSDVFLKSDIARVTINYSYFNNLCYITSLDIDFNRQELRQLINIQIMGQPSSTFDLDKNEWNTLSSNDVCPIIEYNEITLLNSFFNKSIDTIRLSLETNCNTLEKQFIENNMKVYYEYELKNGSSSLKIDINEYFKLKNKIIKKLKNPCKMKELLILLLCSSLFSCLNNKNERQNNKQEILTDLAFKNKIYDFGDAPNDTSTIC